MRTIYVMALEPLENRYTCQWFTEVPRLLKQATANTGQQTNVVNVVGTQTSNKTTSGAFLNFAATNIWKNDQINQVADLFAQNKISAGDKFLFTDAWNTGILQVKYMSELLDVPVEIHSIWHAGSYDPQDFLGRKIKDKAWTFNTERALYHASTHNYFATNFHAQLFARVVLEGKHAGKSWLSGQPHGELVTAVAPYTNYRKKRQIVFPHRIAPEKQPEIFRDLAQSMRDVDFVVCQDHSLTKHQYHEIMAESMIVFSANLQETLGISTAIEGPLMGCVPFVPRRLSYEEIFGQCGDFLYPSEWTLDWKSYQANKTSVINELYRILDCYNLYRDQVAHYVANHLSKYAQPTAMVIGLTT